MSLLPPVDFWELRPDGRAWIRRYSSAKILAGKTLGGKKKTKTIVVKFLSAALFLFRPLNEYEQRWGWTWQFAGWNSQQTAAFLRFNLACRMEWVQMPLEILHLCQTRAPPRQRNVPGSAWSPVWNLRGQRLECFQAKRGLSGKPNKCYTLLVECLEVWAWQQPSRKKCSICQAANIHYGHSSAHLVFQVRKTAASQRRLTASLFCKVCSETRADIHTCQQKAHHFIPAPAKLILSVHWKKHCWMNATYFDWLLNRCKKKISPFASPPCPPTWSWWCLNYWQLNISIMF